MNDIYSFYQLISKYQIEIPIIQRDYAQGRNNAKAADVREKLVRNIIKAVNDEKSRLFFDFVYGRIDGNKFIPFDGQQRLTTLFLFHKYVFEICQSVSECDHKENCICREILKRFSYATRQSSREFCEKLVQEDVVPSDDKKVSENIRNKSWFYPDWKKDPTVMGMLTMLDEIHNQLNQLEGINFKMLAEKLTSGCNCPITFHFVDMGEHRLSDETYVKMNARGKQLTPFENFKASLEQYLEEKLKQFKDKEKESLTEEEKDKYDNLLRRFKGEFNGEAFTGIDGTWLDLFWKVANEGKTEKELPDTLMMSFFNRHFMNVWRCWYAGDFKNEKEISKIERADEREQEQERQKEYKLLDEQITNVFPLYPTKDQFIPFEIYQGIIEKCGIDNCLTPLFNICDTLSDVNNRIENDCQAVWNRNKVTNDKWDLFQRNAKDETYRSRTAFYALLKFYENAESERPSLAQWMRVVWNIIENYVEREESYIPALLLINDIAEKSFNISQLGDNYNGVAKDQVKEEIAKAKQILNEVVHSDGKTWEDIISEAESYAFFKGAIRFLFTKDEIGDDWNNFDIKWENAKKYFDEKKPEEDHYKNLRIFISKCSKESELKNIIYDILPNSWKKNLLNTYLNNTTDYFLSEKETECLYLFDEKWLKVQEDLVKTKLLDNLSYNGSHVNGSRLRDDKYSLVALFPPGANSNQKKYVIGHIRNTILSDLCKSTTITCDQKINDCDFFWGWDICFQYNKFDFQWNTDGNVYLLDNGGWKYLSKDNPLRTNIKDVADSDELIEKLNCLITQWQANEKGQPCDEDCNITNCDKNPANQQ